MSDTVLTNEEFAALVALDGGFLQRRPDRAIETKLRKMGLIYLFQTSGLPLRTTEGEALVKARLQPKV